MEIREEDTFIKIDNKYIRELDTMLNSDELTILCIILMNQGIKHSCIFNIDYILKTLQYKSNNARKIKEIKHILHTLQQDNIIELYNSILLQEHIDIDKVNKYDLIYCKTEEPPLDNFTMLYDKELFKLIEISKIHNIDCMTLINLVIYIYSFINKDEASTEFNLGYPSYERISDELGIGESTISKYTDILKIEKIIECDFAGYKVTSNGKIKNSKQYYCRYKDRNKLKDMLESERQKEGFLKLSNRNKNKSNTKRSIKQILNTIEKKRINNTITELEEERYRLLKEKYNEFNLKK